MKEIFDPRIADDGPSELAIDAYVLGEADPEEVAAVEAWMAADPANAALVDARRSGFDALPDARPQAMLARIRQGLDAAEAEARPEPARPEPRRAGFSLMQWLVGGLALAGAAAALLVFANRPQAPTGITPPGETVMAKSGLKLTVFRARGDDVESLLSGDSVTAGDRLRFVAENVPQGPGQLMVVGVEADGAVFPYFPAEGRSIAAHGTLQADGALPGSAVLDPSQGREQVWLVWCPQAFGLDALKPTNDGLKTRGPCRVDGLSIDKK